MSVDNTNIAELTTAEFVHYTNIVLVPTGGAAILEGAPGFAKSESTAQNIVANQNLDPDFGGCMSNLASDESIDLRGLPNIAEFRSTYGMPAWLFPVPHLGLRGAFPIFCPEHLRGEPDSWSPELRFAYETAEDQIRTRNLIPYSRGIVALDECTQTIEESVLLSLAQLLLEHRVKEWGVPIKGWAMVGLTNRTTDRSGARELPAHVCNRIARFQLKSDMDATADYWRQRGMNQYFRHFALLQPGTIANEAVPTTAQQFCTPRSWTQAHDECMAWFEREDGLDLATVAEFLPKHDHPMLRILIAARCGTAAALSFTDFLQTMTFRPSYKQILADPMNAKLPGQSAVIRAVVEMLIDKTRVPDLSKVCRYMSRPDMPRTMIAIFCNRLSRRISVQTLYTHRDFMDLLDRAGSAGRTMVFGQAHQV